MCVLLYSAYKLSISIIAGFAVLMGCLPAYQYAGNLIAGLCVMMAVTLRDAAHKLFGIAGVIMLMGFHTA